MKVLLKNWSLPINCNSFYYKNRIGFLPILFFLFITSANAQIANYVNNGSFEIPKYYNAQKAKYWEATDTTKYVGVMYSAIIPPYLVPASGPTYQWPRSGNAWFGSTLFYKPNSPQTARGYPRNTLKGILQVGKTYCVKFYCNVTNNSTYGVDGLGAYFGDNSTDTIHYCMTPITYLTPQIQNPTNNILSDTLNWTLITGTFVASGTEKYMMLGNFKSDVATNSVMINTTTTVITSEIIYDDVSVIDIDLPAFAGPDIWGIPFNTVYLGRPLDVGIDEACMWYHLPNTTTSIDTAAGITVTVAATTQTYMVKQDICGNIKYDTVVVYPSGVGVTEFQKTANSITLYPNPTNKIATVDLGMLTGQTIKIEITDCVGTLIREEDIQVKTVNHKISLDLNTKAGVYLITIKNHTNESITKKLVITD